MDSALIFSIKCLPNCLDSDLEDFSDLLSAAILTSQILKKNTDMPIESVTISIQEESYGEKYFYVTCPLKSEISGMVSGVIQASGINHVDVELKVDEKNQSACFALDVDLSRNVIELAQEMADLPQELASFAQMYNEADLVFKFKTWENLVGNELLTKLIPNRIATECEQVMSGAVLEILLKKVTEIFLSKVMDEKEKFIIASMYTKAMTCLQELRNISFVVNNSVFKCDVVVPNLIQQLQVALPDGWDDDENNNKNFDPSFHPSPYTVSSHEHELTLQKNLYGGLGYICDSCKNGERFNRGYGYHCEICQYDLHPNCALEQ
jgi:hypothetical protein